VFDNEHSLYLWKRHPCTSTVERQLTDWHKQVTAWRDLHGLLCSHSDTVCLLIQSNCIELQPSINILMRVAWLFYHSVQSISKKILCPHHQLVIQIGKLWEFCWQPFWKWEIYSPIWNTNISKLFSSFFQSLCSFIANSNPSLLR
jgi:hypothetical protein